MDRFLQWASKIGITLENVAIRKSSLGGFGVFATSNIAADSVVIRIPYNTVYDLENLLALAEKVKAQDSTGTASSVINSVLEAGGHSSEVIIIRSFIWAMAILQSTSMPDLEISPYLEILMNTDTLDICWSPEDSISSSKLPESDLQLDFDKLSLGESAQGSNFSKTDFFDTISQLRREKAMVYKDYITVTKACSAAKSLSFAQFFQLHQAVKSRVLEIPHEDTSDPESGDFVTNVTLVPMLDFANHNHFNTAVFDVDRETGDIVLRVQKDIASGSEITISYSPEDNANDFLQTYGFIPNGPVTITMQLPLGELASELEKTSQKMQESDEKEMKREESKEQEKETEEKIADSEEAQDSRSRDYTYIAKWLQIAPEITFKVDKNAVEIVSENFRLPLLFIPELAYYPDWPSEIEDIAQEFEVEPEMVAPIVEALAQQEASARTIEAGDTAFGVIFQGQYASVSHILAQTGRDSGQIDDLAAKTARMLARAGDMWQKDRKSHKAGEIGEKGSPIAKFEELTEIVMEAARAFTVESVLAATKGGLDLTE